MLPPDDSPCWAGDWGPVDPMVGMWVHSAVVRTVAALPSLHAWRLGDDKGTRRTLVWSAAPATSAPIDGGDKDGVAVLTQTAPPPSLPLGDVGPNGEVNDFIPASSSLTGVLLSTLASSLSRSTADALADAFAGSDGSEASGDPDFGNGGARPYRPAGAGVRRWVGGMAQVPGAWLPDLAILPRSERDMDDPGTRWSTESMAFAARHSVHAADTRFASDVLAPHVTALVLEHVSADAAVTVSGDAIHIWWEYTDDNRTAVGKADRTVEVAVRIRDALPSFIATDYPDHSHRVEERLAERAARAAAYRASRSAGRHDDPTLQRIYAQAQADYESGQGRP